MYKYIFDLDNTIVFTDKLNSEAYNYALKLLGKDSIYNVKRITREVVFSKYNLTEDEKKSLVNLKQKYFLENVGKIHINEDLLKFLDSKCSADCILWTSAEKGRVEAILNYLQITKKFLWIFYSNKMNLSDDLIKICRYFGCLKTQLKFYEDDCNVLNGLKLLGIDNVVKV